MSFTHTRTIRFQDTDAAGVVYFANVLAICHEAYEESLAASGINLKSFFSDPCVAIPIVHASVDFLRPMFCGDKLLVHSIANYLTNNEFEVSYQIVAVVVDKVVAKAITKHVCINPVSRTRTQLPDELIQWLQLPNEELPTVP